MIPIVRNVIGMSFWPIDDLTRDARLSVARA
jgi:hypothetical protein